MSELQDFDRINQDGEKLLHEVTEAAVELTQQIQNIMALENQATHLSKKYDKKPFTLGLAMSRLYAIEKAIKYWYQEIKYWEKNQT